jgi:ribonuclease HI
MGGPRAKLTGPSGWGSVGQRKQEQELVEALQGAEGFANTEKDARYQAVARALTQATLQLTRLSKAWQVRTGIREEVGE